MKQNLRFVENANGRQFAIKILASGDKYGLQKGLTWEHDRLGVEFYDVTYAGDGFDELGQFVSRYYLDTLLNNYPFNGLCLDGGIPAWNIDGVAMSRVYHWLITKNTESKASIKTGFRDRNGGEIFSGGVLSKSNHWDLLVVWDEKKGCFMCEIIHEGPEMRLKFPLEEISKTFEIKK